MSGIINISMRKNYDTLVPQVADHRLHRYGVSQYYTLVQESYRNPHYAGLKKVIREFMDRYIQHESATAISILDLAAGSGEATEALLDWKAQRWPPASEVPAAFAAPTNSATSARPPVARPAPRQFPSRAVARPSPGVNDATISLRPPLPPPRIDIVAADPFTAPAYLARTGLPCLELSFSDVADGKLPLASSEPADSLSGPDRLPAHGRYDIVIISFALHLVETSSELWALLTELSKRARWLVVIAPHKKPDIKPSWGWTRWDPSAAWCPAEGRRGKVGGTEGDGFEIVLDRVRLRLWRSDAEIELEGESQAEE